MANPKEPSISISEVTRLDIIDVLRAKKINWHGRSGEIEFLSRLFDLKKLPSTDHRYDTAEEDIQVHRVSFPGDWEDDWVFTDERFNLLRGSDEDFLRFLCAMLNPLVRPHPKEVNTLLKLFNKFLAMDGWELYAKSHISRRRVFGARLISKKDVVEIPLARKNSRTTTVDLEDQSKSHDLFICHASEDKKGIARPLAEELTRLGYRVWFDEFTLKLGDSLRRSIDHGLASSQYGIVILSPKFFAKNWPQYELDGLVQRENNGGGKVILPIWHEVTREQVAAQSPTLADRVASLTSAGLENMCKEIAEAIGNPSKRRRASPS